MKKILLTGANGFIGKGVCHELAQRSLDFRSVVREAHSSYEYGIGEITEKTDWSNALDDCEVIIHLAARVHVMRETAKDPLAAFRASNLVAIVNLARQAVQQGVQRFVFVSSIKVNGELTEKTPFHASNTPTPQDAYGQSKLEAEQALQALSHETGLEVVIIRPPLVYGPGVRANFLRLMQLVHKGIPLPLGAIRNLRSFVALDNLVDLLIVCTQHPAAAGKTFLVSDGKDISTPDLLRLLADAMKKPLRLLPVPPKLITFFATLLGQSMAAERLLGSLQVDIEETKSILGWNPTVSMEEAIYKTVSSFLQTV